MHYVRTLACHGALTQWGDHLRGKQGHQRTHNSWL